MTPAEVDRAERQELERKLVEAKERFGTIHLAIDDVKRETRESAIGEGQDDLSDELSDLRGEVDWLWDQIREYEKALNPRES